MKPTRKKSWSLLFHCVSIVFCKAFDFIELMLFGCWVEKEIYLRKQLGKFPAFLLFALESQCHTVQQQFSFICRMHFPVKFAQRMRPKFKWKMEMSQLFPYDRYVMRCGWVINVLYSSEFHHWGQANMTVSTLRIKRSAGWWKQMYTRVQSHWDFRPVNTVISRSAFEFIFLPFNIYFVKIQITKWVVVDG